MIQKVFIKNKDTNSINAGKYQANFRSKSDDIKMGVKNQKTRKEK